MSEKQQRPTDQVPPEVVARIKELYEFGALPGDIAKSDIGMAHGLTHFVVMGLAKREGWKRPIGYDIDAVKRDYMAGHMSDKEVCRKHGITDRELKSAVIGGKWQRSLAKRIQQQADARIQSEVARQVAEKKNEITEDAIVEANAIVQANITKHHRSGASTARETALKLMAEMGVLALNPAELRQLAELAARRQVQHIDDFDEQDKAYERALDNFLKLLDLGERSKTLKNLVQALSQAIDVERKVYGIKEEAAETDVIKGLRELAGDA